MRSNRFATYVLASCSLFGLAGCAASGGDTAASGNEPVGTSAAALRALQDNEKLGSMNYGDTKTVAYTETPLFRAYSFTGNAGDNIDILVKSVTSSHAMAWLLAADYTTLASDGGMPDSSGTLPANAHIAYSLTSAGTYWIAFREASQESATFNVALNGPPADVFSPNNCNDGTSFTSNQAIHYFSPGTDTSSDIAHIQVFKRWRSCNQVTGCMPWQDNTKDITYDSDGKLPIHTITAYAGVVSQSQIELFIKTDVDSGQFSKVFYGQDPLGSTNQYRYTPQFTDHVAISEYGISHIWNVSSTCLSWVDIGATPVMDNGDYTMSSVAFYGAILPPTN